jgi:hypothetical protein
MSYAASPQATNSNPLLLCRRLPVSEPVAGALRLALGAEDRTGLRGLRHSSCGRALLLQLPQLPHLLQLPLNYFQSLLSQN